MSWWSRALAWVLGISKRAASDDVEAEATRVDVDSVLRRVERLELEARLIQRRRGAS